MFPRSELDSTSVLLCINITYGGDKKQCMSGIVNLETNKVHCFRRFYFSFRRSKQFFIFRRNIKCSTTLIGAKCVAKIEKKFYCGNVLSEKQPFRFVALVISLC